MWLLENGKSSLWFTLTADIVFLLDSVAMDAAILSGVCWASAHICHCAHLCTAECHRHFCWAGSQLLW